MEASPQAVRALLAQLADARHPVTYGYAVMFRHEGSEWWLHNGSLRSSWDDAREVADAFVDATEGFHEVVVVALTVPAGGTL